MKNEDIIKKTIDSYEEIAGEYYSAHLNVSTMKNQIDFFIKNLPGKNILDIGCAFGRDAKYFTEMGFDVFGVDLAPNFIKIASKNVPDAKFTQMDMRFLDFPENSFDGLWICSSFLHIPKDLARKTLIGFKKVLKKNGLMYVCVKQGNSEGFVRCDKYNSNKERYFSYYLSEKFKKLVEDAGFKIIKFSTEKKKDIWLNIFARKLK